MGNTNNLNDIIKNDNHKCSHVSINTSIKDFLHIVGFNFNANRVGKGILPYGIYLSLREISRHISTIGELKSLAENADGFARLKNGVYFNNGKCLPYKALRNFGKKKLEALNDVLSEYGIESIPWVTRKYHAWERKKERGEDWYEKLEI